jgi:hypothetical protein
MAPWEMMPPGNGGAPLTETMMSPGRSPWLAAGDPGSTAVMNSGGSASCGAVWASGGAGEVMIPRSPGRSPGGGAG